MMKNLITVFACAALIPVFGADKSNDLLLVSVGESYNRYSDVVVHLQGLLAGTPDFSGVQVDIEERVGPESLADAYYDPNSGDQAVRAAVIGGYKYVILIPTIHTVPHRTIEYTLPVYDDAPIDNEFFAPEVFYEGCKQLSKLILDAGSTPMIFLPRNADEDVSVSGSVMCRVAGGVGLELIPGAYAVEAAGTTDEAEQQYLYACSIFTRFTGLNANAANYSPSGIENEVAVNLADFAENTVNIHHSTEHYTSGYETNGAVVYRSLDISGAPFNNVVRYRYKGTSSHDWTRDAINAIVNSNDGTSAAYRKLGTKNGLNSYGTRYWHADDLPLRAGAISSEPEQAAFMFVTGSIEGSALAQELIDLDQSNMVPLVFDWIKSFAIEPAVSGTASTLDALDYHGCIDMYYNYVERGWKLVPLVVGMGRLNEAIPDFVASNDALHMSDLLVYMNAYMMLSSSLGIEFPLPAEIGDYNIHRGSHTVENLTTACQIGHAVVREHAFLSETGGYVPDSDLAIISDSLTEEAVGKPYTNQLSAAGGDGTYSWEVISSEGMPAGLSLSGNGLISGAAYEQGTFNLAFKVTDGAGAFRKVGLKLTIDPNGELPIARADHMMLLENTTADILLTGVDSEGSSSGLTYEVIDWPANGTLTGTAPDLTYAPDPGFVGADNFSFKVSDGVNVSVPAAVSISVGPSQSMIAFADLNAALSENSLMVNGSTSNVAVEGTASGSDYVYTVTYTGSNFDYDGVKDALNFDVRVKGWSGGITDAAIDVPGSTNGASATIGTTASSVVFSGTMFVVGDVNMNNGESLEFQLENLTVSLTDSSKFANAAATGFTSARLEQNSATGNSHQAVFGSGTGLAGWDFNTHQESGVLDVDTGSLFVSSDLGVGTRSTRWGVANVDFGISVSVGKAGAPDSAIMEDAGRMALTWTAVSGTSYCIMATTNLVEGPWVEMTNGVSGNDELVAVTNALSEGQQFFRVDYEN